MTSQSDSQIKIDQRYSEFQSYYLKTYPPNGVPDTPRALDLKQAIDLAYSMWLTSPMEYGDVISGLFDEFDAAIALISL